MDEIVPPRTAGAATGRRTVRPVVDRDAAPPPHRLAGSPTGVYVGISTADYGLLLHDEGHMDPWVGTGNCHTITVLQM